jgi:hypothetical protein
MIRGHLSPLQAALTLAFMRLGLAARVACFGLMRKTEAAASCRGSLDGLRQTPVARLDAAGPIPSVEVVRPV